MDAPRKPTADYSDRRYALLAFRIVGQFGAAIAVPVVVLVIVGMRLDSMYGTTPYLRIAGFVLAAIITAVIINKRARSFGREYEALNREATAIKDVKH